MEPSENIKTSYVSESSDDDSPKDNGKWQIMTT